jgi:hypothetical protein
MYRGARRHRDDISQRSMNTNRYGRWGEKSWRSDTVERYSPAGEEDALNKCSTHLKHKPSDHRKRRKGRTFPKAWETLPSKMVMDMRKVYNSMLVIHGIRSREIDRSQFKDCELFDLKGFAICHRKGCCSSDVKFKYNGFFCMRHLMELGDIRARIYTFTYSTQGNSIPMLQSVIEARETEADFRKIPEPGHQSCISHLKERLQTLIFFNERFLQIDYPIRGQIQITG